MAAAPTKRQYRIGDFARFMGVTPDFLKHYEELGLLSVEQRASGYRFYSFEQSARILEYMRLRSYGVALREMGEMLSGTTDEAMRRLDARADALRRRMEFDAAVLEEHRRVQAWFAERRVRPVDWEIRRVEPQLFLPHSTGTDFLKDPRIYEILRGWIERMPLVKSALRLEPADASAGFAAGAPLAYQWGLVMNESLALDHGLPVNDAVIRIPARKAFVWHFTGSAEECRVDDVIRRRHPMFERMAEMGLEPRGSVCMEVEMKLSTPDGRPNGGCGRFVAPIGD